MKKFLALLLVSAMVFAFTACSQSEGDYTPPERTAVEYDSLEEINELTGGMLTHPGVMGVTDEKFSVLDETIAQYEFTVNGQDFCFRFANTEEDISDLVLNGQPAFADGLEATVNTGDGIIASRWFTMDGQYVLITTDDIDANTFADISYEMEELTSALFTAEDLEEIYAGLQGSYQDSFSQRASAEIVANGSESVSITVYWGSSASEMDEWTMTAVAQNDGSLTYTDCCHTRITFAEDGSDDAVVLSDNGEGYFAVTNGSLSWEGAEDESCRDCLFEKMPTVEEN